MCYDLYLYQVVPNDVVVHNTIIHTIDPQAHCFLDLHLASFFFLNTVARAATAFLRESSLSWVQMLAVV